MNLDVLVRARRTTAEGAGLKRPRQIPPPAPLPDTASLRRTVLP